MTILYRALQKNILKQEAYMKIKLFYLKHCPYCKSAFKALDELKEENPLYKKIEIETIEESDQPKKTAVPTEEVKTKEEEILENTYNRMYDFE